MIKYLNWKSTYGIETIDELDSKDFKTIKDFKSELNRLMMEYGMTGQSTYISQRCDKTWMEIV